MLWCFLLGKQHLLARLTPLAVLQMSNPKTAHMIEMSQSRLVRYVFNYNVLESVSLAVSTCILLAGMVRAGPSFSRPSCPSLCTSLFSRVCHDGVGTLWARGKEMGTVVWGWACVACVG